VADTILKPAPVARYARRHRSSARLPRSVTVNNKAARRTAAQESPALQPPPIEAPSTKDIAAAAIEACARALEAWAEFSQRADLLHNAAATLRKASGAVAAEAIKPVG